MCDYIHWYLFVHLRVLLIFHSAHFPIKVLQLLHVWIDACHCYFMFFFHLFFPLLFLGILWRLSHLDRCFAKHLMKDGIICSFSQCWKTREKYIHG